MHRRAPVGWYLGLGAVILIPAAIALVVIWIASGQQIAANQFYESQGNAVISDEDYRYWDGIYRNAYQLVSVVAPTLFTGTMVAIFALLAVLAFRSERRRRVVPQAEAPTAAS